MPGLSPRSLALLVVLGVQGAGSAPEVPILGATAVCLGASVYQPASGAPCAPLASPAAALPSRLGEHRRAKRAGCACAGKMRAGCVFQVRRVKSSGEYSLALHAL